MSTKYTYSWYIDQFEKSRAQAEDFILSVDEASFLQPPSQGRWSIAECYNHLINYGNLYFDNMESEITQAHKKTEHMERAFEPRWIFKKICGFFEPPYKIKLKTVEAMKPNPVEGYNRMEILDEYLNLQDRLIAQLEKARHRHIDLCSSKIRHPLLSIIKMTLADCYALMDAHQRRHQWQAKQTLKALKEQL